MKSGIYILESLKNGKYYIGNTSNINQRLFQHNSGLVKSTKNLRPLKLKAFLPCNDANEARFSERKLKKYKRKDIIEKVIKDKIFPWNYSRP